VLAAMELESVFLSVRPIVLSLARSTMPSSTTLFSNNRKVQRAYHRIAALCRSSVPLLCRAGRHTPRKESHFNLR
jgi:hypothetical protein